MLAIEQVCRKQRKKVVAIPHGEIRLKSSFRLSVVKTKTKAIIPANHRKGSSTWSQWELKVKTSELPVTRENAGDQVVIDVSLSLIGWEGGASFLDRSANCLDQSHNEIVLDYFRRSIENCSDEVLVLILTQPAVLPHILIISSQCTYSVNVQIHRRRISRNHSFWYTGVDPW